jgi:hypothetical protein
MVSATNLWINLLTKTNCYNDVTQEVLLILGKSYTKSLDKINIKGTYRMGTSVRHLTLVLTAPSTSNLVFLEDDFKSLLFISVWCFWQCLFLPWSHK